MKKYNILRFVFQVCLVLSLGFVASCDNEDEEGTKEVQLLSFGPSGVHHGDEIKFIGTNLDQVTSILLPGVEVPRAEFVSVSASEIKLIVPEAAEAGKVTLKTPSGDIISKTVLNFEVPVEITSITAEAKPGTNISIKGSLVNWIEEIMFSEEIVVTEFVSKSLDEVVVTVPMEAQSGFLIFRTGGTEPLTFASEAELIVTLPAITEIAPLSVKHTDNITITGTDLDLVTSVSFSGGKVATEFVSQTETEIVVVVPVGATKGKITLNQASPVSVTSQSEITIILPAATNLTPKPAKPGVDKITITGTNLDLVAKLGFQQVAAMVPAADFDTHTATTIVVLVPAGAKNGAVSYETIHGYTNNLGINLLIPGAGPPPLAITMFDETINFGGGSWSWGGTADPASTEQAYSGSVSFKHTTSGSDGGPSVGGMTGVDASALAVFKFSLYGGPGTNGKSVAAILGSDGSDKWDSYNSVVIQEGKWTEYSIPLTNYATVNKSNITRWIFKVEGASNVTIYVDRVGFDPAGPPPLDYYIYDDQLQNSWSKWDGWGHSALDFASTEEVFKGSKAIKVTYNDTWGAIQIGSPSAAVFSGYTTLSFRIYAPAAQNFLVQLNNDTDYGVALVQGWNEINIPIANIAGNASVTELRLKNNNANHPVTLYVDEIGLKN